MGIETLQSAARAAGYAMAATEDGDNEATPRAHEPKDWRPAEALLLPRAEPPQPGKFADTMRAVLGFLGRRAPASPA
jgi:hypothetical protein